MFMVPRNFIMLSACVQTLSESSFLVLLVLSSCVLLYLELSFLSFLLSFLRLLYFLLKLDDELIVSESKEKSLVSSSENVELLLLDLEDEENDIDEKDPDKIVE